MINRYVTVLKADYRTSKRFTRDETGNVIKDGAVQFSNGTGRTVFVPDCDAFKELLGSVADKTDEVIIPSGYFQGSEPEITHPLAEGPEFHVLSRKKITEEAKIDPNDDSAVLGWHDIHGEQCIARLKANMVPSGWMMFDRDEVKGMPDELANMNDDEWLQAMYSMVPGLDQVSMVKVPSSSGRVLVDGIPQSATGRHYYVPIQDAYDLERFGGTLLQRSFLTQHGFMRNTYSTLNPDEVTGKRQWSIFDPTTFSHERLSYEGAPSLEGPGLELDNHNIKVIYKGSNALDTSQLENLTPEEIDQIKAKTGRKISHKKCKVNVTGTDGKISERFFQSITCTDDQSLNLDTVIETEFGRMSLEEFWSSKHDKVRCQATFRESTSMNGYLNRHEDFSPFLFDNGTRTKFVLPADILHQHKPQAWINRLSKLSSNDQILERWTDKLRSMDEIGRQFIVEWVHLKTKVGRDTLKAMIRGQKDQWKSEEIKIANDNKRDGVEQSGKVPVIYSPLDVGGAISRVEDVIFANPSNDMVFAHTDRLVTVHPKCRTTVGNTVPGYEITEYSKNTLQVRLEKSCAFFKSGKDGEHVQQPVPIVVAQTMVEDSYHRAPALVGLMEYPAIKHDGSLVPDSGYDQDTGLLSCMPDHLAPTLPEQITQEMAADSYQWIAETALDEFPFASDLDRAGAVAMILTAIQRRLITGSDGAPMFATSSPVQASGKTTLIQLMSFLVQGKAVPVNPWPGNEEEIGKTLMTKLMAGMPIILFDNLPAGGRIESTNLASATTSETFCSRLLGHNREAEAPTNVLWCFTGNNIVPVDDFNTRLINIYLDPDVENPDQKTFKRPNWQQWCKDHRGDFYYHALIVLAGYRRYIRDNKDNPDFVKPVKCTPTRFHDWDKQVREPMLWVGAEDPAKLFERNKTADPLKEGRKELLAAWHEVYGSKPVQLKQVLDDCRYASDGSPKKCLHEAIDDFTNSGNLTSKGLSTILQKFVNQWFGSYRIQKAPQSEKSKSSAKWYVENKHASDAKTLW